MKGIFKFLSELEKAPMLSLEIAGNSLFRWFSAVLVFAFLYFCTRILCSIVIKMLTRTAENSQNQFDDIFIPVLQSIRRSLLGIIAFCLSIKTIHLPEKLDTVVDAVLMFSLLIQTGIAGASFLDQLLGKMLSSREEDSSRSSATGLLRFLFRTILWAILLAIFLDNLGINITALVAGLGVGGIAVALAVQNVLGDLLGSLSIVLDKPFRVGDFIVVGESLGTVEKIGIKTTRLKSITGEQLVVSNSDLLSSRIRNFKRMYERRVVFEIGVTYQTPPEALKKIKDKVAEIIQGLDGVRFDRAHFKNFGDSALVFEIVYFVLSSDYLIYMDCQEKINTELLMYFNEQGFEFAYPTQTIFVEKVA